MKILLHNTAKSYRRKLFTIFMLFEVINSVGKCLMKSMQQVLALRQSRLFKYLRLLFKTCQKHRDSISHIERTVNVLGGDLIKITITNASIDKQKNFEAWRDYKYGSRNRGFRRFILYTIIC